MARKDVSIITFEAHMSVHYEYIPDGTGSVRMNLVGTDENTLIVFLHDARYNWLGQKDALVLNTKINGQWQNEVRPSGFPFTPNVKTAVTAISGPSQFSVFANGNSITNYQVPTDASITSIKGVSIIADENSPNPQIGIIAIGRVRITQ